MIYIFSNTKTEANSIGTLLGLEWQFISDATMMVGIHHPVVLVVGAPTYRKDYPQVLNVLRGNSSTILAIVTHPYSRKDS